jgi:hypothetical protein
VFTLGEPPFTSQIGPVKAVSTPQKSRVPILSINGDIARPYLSRSGTDCIELNWS